MLPISRRLSCLPTLRRSFSTQRWPALSLSPEITSALATHTPIVALETAIVTHGLPSPLNIQTALNLERIIREGGAVPATIGVLEGRPIVGMNKNELERLADRPVKVSRRDLSAVLALGRNGGTTVAGTMYIAQQVGIDLFVTGGIGGVHRGGEVTLDVSADLTELGRTPMAVICAGAKSILDIGRTLEFLETQGVTVATYGPTTDFPAFYSQKSGFQSPWNVDSIEQAAKLIHTGLTLPTPLSTLLAVPIPDEFQPAGAAIQEAVEQAVKESLNAGIVGKEMTPWLLARVGELTKGRATTSNLALIENNARVGTKIAVELSKLRALERQEKAEEKTFYSGVWLGSSDPFPPGAPSTSSPSPPTPALPPPKILIIGSAAVDITSQSSLSSSTLSSATTHPGRVSFSPGGVALNVALCATKLSPSPENVMLVAPVGEDALGGMLSGMLGGLGMRGDGLLSVKKGEGEGEEKRTACCSLVLGREGDLEGGVADMGIVEGLQGEELLSILSSLPQTPPPLLIAFDGNLSPSTITSLLTYCSSDSIPTFFEPTSLPKSLRILPALKAKNPTKQALVSYISPNLLELRAIHEAMEKEGMMDSEEWWEALDGLGLGGEWREGVGRWGKRNGCAWLGEEGVIQRMISLTPFFPTQLVKLGSRGVVSLRRLPSSSSTSSFTSPSTLTLTHSSPTSSLHLTFHPPSSLSASEIVSSTGAGDSLVGAVLAGLSERPDAVGDDEVWVRIVERGQRAARESLKGREAVGRGVGVVGGEGEWRV